MKKYSAYKPSGIEWIGDVPAEWKKCRFKNFITLVSVAACGGNKIGMENIESGSGKFLPSNADFEGNGVAFSVGDVIYGKLRPYLMKVWIAEFDGNAVGDFFVFRPQKNADSKFVKYLMLSDGFTKAANGATEGAKMPRVSSDFIMTLKYFLPSKDEQIAIAAYLDAKCAKIDNVISVQQKRIELFKELKQSVITNAVTKGLDKNIKLRPSGIDWIGSIPEKWKVMKLKHVLLDYRDGTHASFPRVVSDYPLLSAKNVFEDGIKITDEESTISEDAYKSIISNGFPRFGDVAVCCVGTIGRCCLYTLKDPHAFQRSVTFLRPNKNALNSYLVYLMRSDVANPQYVMYAKTSAQSGIYMDALVNFKIVVPPKEEQIAIATYLEKKCSAIDSQISKIERQIELLKEYKQSIITECVTGKRKVC